MGDPGDGCPHGVEVPGDGGPQGLGVYREWGSTEGLQGVGGPNGVGVPMVPSPPWYHPIRSPPQPPRHPELLRDAPGFGIPLGAPICTLPSPGPPPSSIRGGGADPIAPPAAAGLYYLAELIEEYTVVTRRIIKYMIWVSGGLPGGATSILSPPLGALGTLLPPLTGAHSRVFASLSA